METRFFANWVTQVRKGVLELCVLRVLSDSRVYGYELVGRLSGVGGLAVSAGTLYPILNRFQKEGLVAGSLEESPSGPARKYYSLTRRGQQYLVRMEAHWGELLRGVEALLEEVGEAAGGDVEV